MRTKLVDAGRALGAGSGLCKFCCGVCCCGGLFIAVLRDFGLPEFHTRLLPYLWLCDCVKASGINLFFLLHLKRHGSPVLAYKGILGVHFLTTEHFYFLFFFKILT